MKIKGIIIGLLTVAIMVTSTTGCYASEKHDGMTWKTSKGKSGYVTKIYDDGKYQCKVVTKKKLSVKVVKSENLTYKKIVNRNNKYILVEKINGKCINKKGDGKTTDGYYISYKSVKNHKKGGKYTTYCIYDNNRYEDDIIARIDYRRK